MVVWSAMVKLFKRVRDGNAMRLFVRGMQSSLLSFNVPRYSQVMSESARSGGAQLPVEFLCLMCMNRGSGVLVLYVEYPRT